MKEHDRWFVTLDARMVTPSPTPSASWNCRSAASTSATAKAMCLIPVTATSRLPSRSRVCVEQSLLPHPLGQLPHIEALPRDAASILQREIDKAVTHRD